MLNPEFEPSSGTEYTPNQQLAQIEAEFERYKPRLLRTWQKFTSAHDGGMDEDAAVYKEQAFSLISTMYIDIYRKGLLGVDMLQSSEEPDFFLIKLSSLVANTLHILDEQTITEFIYKSLIDIASLYGIPRNLMAIPLPNGTFSVVASLN